MTLCNGEKWPKILLNSCDVNTTMFLKHVWPFFSIMNEKIKPYQDKFENKTKN